VKTSCETVVEVQGGGGMGGLQGERSEDKGGAAARGEHKMAPAWSLAAHELPPLMHASSHPRPGHALRPACAHTTHRTSPVSLRTNRRATPSLWTPLSPHRHPLLRSALARRQGGVQARGIGGV